MKKSTIITFGLLLVVQVGLFAEVHAVESTARKQDSKDVETEEGPSTHSKQKFRHFAFVNAPMNTNIAYEYGPFKSSSVSKPGFLIEKGAMRFYSDNFMFKGKGNIGLYSSRSFGAISRDFAMPSTTYSYTKTPFLTVDLKLGPVLHLEVTKTLKLNLYGNIGGLISYGGYVSEKVNTTGNFTIFYLPTFPAIALQTGFGMDILIKRFVFGAQYTMAKGKFKFDITEDLNVYGESAPTEKPIEYNVSLNSFRVYIGYYLHKHSRQSKQ